MPRRKAKVGPIQKFCSYAILATLGLIFVWLLFQQFRFNPAVLAALQGVQLKGRPQAASGESTAAAAALFPEVPGFSPLAPVQSFGPDNLSDKIDGKAELYLSAGFARMSCRSFNVGDTDQAFVEVFVYDMGSASNAYAVFSGQRRPGSPSISLTANAYATPNALFFTQGKFYVEIVADRASEALANSLQAYAKALLAQIPSEPGATGQAGLFPKEGLAPDTVRLSAADTFGLEGFNNVFTGEYTLKDGTVTAFLAERDTPEQADGEARKYREFLTANGYEKIQSPAAPAGAEIFKLDNSFEIIMVQGRTLAGVHDASSLEAALDLAAILSSRFKVQNSKYGAGSDGADGAP
jgi:hypothetical protein